MNKNSDQKNKIEKINAQGFKIDQVWKEIFENADAVRNQGQLKHKTCLMVLGGAMRGVYGSGGVMALEEEGLTDSFSLVWGSSTGAPTLAYFLSKQAKVVSTIYLEDCASDDFFRFEDSKNDENEVIPSMDIDFVGDIFSGKRESKFGCKKNDLSRMLNSKANFIVNATNVVTGETEFINIKKIRNPIDGIKASAAVPVLFSKEIEIDGKLYIDGDMGEIFPIKKIIESEFSPSSFLIFANRPKSFLHKSLLTKIFSFVEGLYFNSNMKHSIEYSHQNFEASLKFLKNSKVPFCIVWTDSQVGLMERKHSILMSARDRYFTFIKSLISKYRMG